MGDTVGIVPLFYSVRESGACRVRGTRMGNAMNSTKNRMPKQVRVKTGVQPQSAYNPKNVFDFLKNVAFRTVAYDWDDSNPDEITWQHFLEMELAKVLRKNCVPWPDVYRCQCKNNSKTKEIKMVISMKDRFLAGILSWK